MSEELFSLYQAGSDLDAAFLKARENDLFYNGNYLESSEILQKEKMKDWGGGMVPGGALRHLEIALEGKIAADTCFAVPVGDDGIFSWRDENFSLVLEKEDPTISEEDIYRAAVDRLPYPAEWIANLKVKHSCERITLSKEQGSLVEQDVYLVVGETFDPSLTFPSASLAEDEAIRRAESEGGVFEVFALRQGSDGQALFRAQFAKKRAEFVVRLRLAKAGAGDAIGWYFLGTVPAF